MNKHVKQNTIVDIANDTGFSIATVSRALNNSKKVTDKTKEKIQESADRLNYIPNIGAKALVQGETRTIGLLLANFSSINVLLPSLISKELLRHDYNLITLNSDNNPELQDKYIKELVCQRVAALIVLPIPGEYKELKFAINADVHVLVLSRFISEFSVNHILFDFRIGICEAIDHLVLNRGKKHLFQLALKDVYEGIERRKAFQFAIKAHGLVYDYNPVYPVEDTFESGYKMMNKILAKHQKVDAVLCSSDSSAIGAIRALKDKKIKIPEEISVTGFYNSDISDYYDPRISSIDTNITNFSQVIADKVNAMLNEEDEKVKNINLPTKFILKETT